MPKKRVPAIEGWFAMDFAEPRLLGSRCTSCGTYFFPKEAHFCRNPACSGTAFEEAPLSARGKLWSFTDNRYPPPKPYMAPDPFEPYIVAAVELDHEKMVVLGQVAAGVKIGDLSAGMEMELCLDTLFEDDDNEYIVWKWRPAA
jgi:uncharacterized OB-fold protein